MKRKDYLLRPDRERAPMPRMHWRWLRRSLDLAAILDERCGSHLPDDDAGREYLTHLINHMIRLVPNGVSAARANARLRAPWLTVAELDDLISSALDSLNHPPISAAKLGKAFRLTADEMKRRGITTIMAFDHGAEETRRRQREWVAQARRKAGASTKRGRPALDLSPEEKRAHIRAKAAERKRRSRRMNVTENPSTHHPSIRECDVDEFSVTSAPPAFAMIRADAIDLDTIDLAKFGVIAVRVMRGTDVLREWKRGA